MFFQLEIQNNRLCFPAAIVSQFEPFRRGRRIIMTAGLDPVISVYPQVEWEIIVAELERLPVMDRRVRRLQRILFGNAISLRLDGESGVDIPSTLKRYAGIRKNVTVLMFPCKLEIWNSATLQTMISGFNDSQRGELVGIIAENSYDPDHSVLDALCPLSRIRVDPGLQADPGG